MKKTLLFIGQGSIGKRLIGVAQSLGCKTLVYEHRKGLVSTQGVEYVSSLDVKKDAVVITSPTASHMDYALKFAGITPMFIEKPITHETDIRLRSVLAKSKRANMFVMTGFQMRFLPIVEQIQSMIQSGKLGNILHAFLYVGQYLPFWRPGIDYSKSYSTQYAKGGGAALDLIHEIDLALGWFGKFHSTEIQSQRLGDLQVDTETFVRIQTKEKPYIEIILDTLNHNKTRLYTIVGDRGSVCVDIYHTHFEYTDHKGKKTSLTNAGLFDTHVAYVKELSYFLSHLQSGYRHDDTRFLGIDALMIAQKARKKYV